MNYYYVWPKAVLKILNRLNSVQGGVIGLVGFQGVGKSSALRALYEARILKAEEERRVTTRQEAADADFDVVYFKWRRESELFRALGDGTHEASRDVGIEYSKMIDDELLKLKIRHVRVDPKNLRQIIWLQLLRKKRLILIDTPDYSKTDRRLMAKDLQEIYWLWNTLTQTADARPNFIIAIQKEMFRDHYFFDKMEKIELQPLEPKQLLDAYILAFGRAEPFTSEALLELATMSRGIFRRFLRYIH